MMYLKFRLNLSRCISRDVGPESITVSKFKTLDNGREAMNLSEKVNPCWRLPVGNCQYSSYNTLTLIRRQNLFTPPIPQDSNDC